MTHLKDIQGSDSNLLEGHHLALGVCGSIAVLEAPRLARTLMRHGAEVHAVLTPAAAALVTPAAFEWATGNPVVTRLTGRTEHIELCGEHGLCSLLLIAPATASTVGKMANAIDDTPVTTLAVTAIGSQIPTLVAPGMHAPMYEHPGVRNNLRLLTEMGVEVVPPLLEEGKAKMAAPETITAAVLRRLGPGDLAGCGVLITGGPTREPLDPARFLTNPSSGRMAVEMAREALRRRARVTLVYGPGTAEPPPGAEVVRVTTTAEMAEGVRDQLSRRGGFDYFLGVAAVADFRPAEVAREKLPTTGGLTLELVPTEKIIGMVRELAPDITVVGFKAEATPQSLRTRARDLLKKTDLVLANLVGVPGHGFESDTNQLWVVSEGEIAELPQGPKPALAVQAWEAIINCSTRKAGPGTKPG